VRSEREQAGERDKRDRRDGEDERPAGARRGECAQLVDPERIEVKRAARPAVWTVGSP
jgi:hypothetical protein